MSTIYQRNFEAETSGIIPPAGITLTNGGNWQIGGLDGAKGIGAANTPDGSLMLFGDAPVNTNDAQFVSEQIYNGNTLSHVMFANADASNCYAFIYAAATNDTSIYIRTGGTFSQMGTGVGPGLTGGLTANQRYLIKTVAQGSLLRFKVWRSGTAEPAGWNIELTNSTYRTGRVGFYQTGNSAGLYTVADTVTVADTANEIAWVSLPPDRVAYSPQTWASATTMDDGAYFRIAPFTGTTQVQLNFSTSTYAAAGLTAGTNYPKIKYTLNGGTPVVAQIPANGVINIPGLNFGTSYNLNVSVMAFAEQFGRGNPATNIVRLLDPPMNMEAGSSYGTKPLIGAYDLYFGDSITEGVGTIGTPGTFAGVDATFSYASLLAAKLGGDFGQIGFGGQAWTAGGSGGVDSFLNTWKFILPGTARAFTPAPRRVFVNMGTNGNGAATSVYASFITDFRATMPLTQLIFIVPINGAGRANLLAATSGSGDPRVFALTSANDNAGTIALNDSLHPSAAGSATMANLLYNEVQTLPAVIADTELGISQLDAATLLAISNAVWKATTRALTDFQFSVTVGVNSDKSGYGLSSFEHTVIGTDAANALLVTPGQKIATNATNQVVASSVQGNVTGSVASVTGAVGSVAGSVASVTGNVGGNVVGSIGTLSAGAQTNVQTALTAQGYTTARAAFLDTLNGLVASIWGATTRTLSGFGFPVTVATNNDKTGYALTTAEHTAIATDAATGILVTPAQKIATNATSQVVASSVAGNVTGSVASVTGAVGSVTSPVVVGTNNDKTGYALAAAEHTAIATDAATGVLVTPAQKIATNSSNQVTAASVQGNVTGSVASVTGAIGSVTGPVTVGTNNDKSGYALTAGEHTAIASDAASGVLFTPAQKIATNATNQVVASSVTGTVGSVTSPVVVGTNSDKTGYALTPGEHTAITGDAASGVLLTPAQKLATNATNQVVASSVQGNVTGSVASVTGAVGSVAGNVGGNVIGSVGSLSTTAQTNVQTAMTAQGYTSTRAGLLDTLNGLVANIWGATTRTLSAFGFPVTVAVNNDKSGYGLSVPEQNALATVVEAHLLNEGDSQMLINAIVSAIGTSNVDQTILVAAIRSDIERNGGILASIFANYARRTGDYISGNQLDNLPTQIWSQTNRTLTGFTFPVTVGSNLDKTGYALTSVESMVLATGTATNGTSSSITLAIGSSTIADYYKYSLVKIHAGKGSGQVRIIRGYASRVATVDVPWVITPDVTSQYAILAFTDTTPPTYIKNY